MLQFAERMYDALLGLHIIAGMSGVLMVLMTFLATVLNYALPQRVATLVVSSFVFQLVSGACLALISVDVSALALCRRVILYSVLYAAALFTLHSRFDSKLSRRNAVCIAAGLSFFGASLVLGF